MLNSGMKIIYPPFFQRTLHFLPDCLIIVSVSTMPVHAIMLPQPLLLGPDHNMQVLFLVVIDSRKKEAE